MMTNDFVNNGASGDSIKREEILSKINAFIQPLRSQQQQQQQRRQRWSIKAEMTHVVVASTLLLLLLSLLHQYPNRAVVSGFSVLDSYCCTLSTEVPSTNRYWYGASCTKQRYISSLWVTNENRRRQRPPFVLSRTRQQQQLLRRQMIHSENNNNNSLSMANSTMTASSITNSNTMSTTTTSSSSSSSNTNYNGDSSTATRATATRATPTTSTIVYDLGVGKHLPIGSISSSNVTATTAVSSSSSSYSTNDNRMTTTTKELNHENGNESSSASTTTTTINAQEVGMNWMVPESVVKPSHLMRNRNENQTTTATTVTNKRRLLQTITEKKSRRMVARDNEGQILRGALWDEQHYDLRGNNNSNNRMSVNGVVRSKPQQPSIDVSDNNYINEQQQGPQSQPMIKNTYYNNNYEPPYPKAFYPDIDLSIPDTVYSDDVDLVWDLLRYEAYQNQQQQYEPLLVSFLHSTILNHDTLESSLAFLLANRLQSPAMMISTQLQALILSALQDCGQFRRKLRADIMAVRDRDPACHTLPDVFLYFKGFHALQSHRTAHVLWNSGRTVLAQYLQSQVSQIFQIDIHPNATIGSGIMLDHGTGIVIGETATVGHNCSILHHVTLGGSGKKGVVRHPAVGNGVLLGAGATVLGPIAIGDGCQIGAGTLVISDLPPHCVAVGVPARIIGSFVDVTEQPSIGMDQIIMDSRDKIIVSFESDGI